jgi:hypothetical protein
MVSVWIGMASVRAARSFGSGSAEAGTAIMIAIERPTAHARIRIASLPSNTGRFAPGTPRNRGRQPSLLRFSQVAPLAKSGMSLKIGTGRLGCEASRPLVKLGQPVPLSNLVFDENSGRSHPAQAKVPSRFS